MNTPRLAQSTALQDLYSQISGNADLQRSMGQSTSTSHTTTQANASLPLEASIKDWITKQNQVSQDTAGAYTNYQNSFTDIINSLREQAQSQGSRQANAAATSALASGFSPYEAQGAATNTWRDALAGILKGVSDYKSQQSMVGINASKAQSDLMTQYGGFLQGVVAPYQMGRAGTTSDQTTDTQDPSKFYNLLSTLAGNLSTQAYQNNQLALQQQANQTNANQSLWQYLYNMQSLGSAEKRTNVEAGAASSKAQTDFQKALAVQQLQNQGTFANTVQAGQSSGALQNQKDMAAYIRALVGAGATTGAATITANASNPQLNQDYLTSLGF